MAVSVIKVNKDAIIASFVSSYELILVLLESVLKSLERKDYLVINFSSNVGTSDFKPFRARLFFPRCFLYILLKCVTNTGKGRMKSSKIPRTMQALAANLPTMLLGTTSPYPTVVMVMTVQ